MATPSLSRTLNRLVAAFIAAVNRLDKSLYIDDTLAKVRAHKWVLSDAIYVFHLVLACFWISIMPGFPWKLFIPLLYAILVLVPLTSQFFFRGMPVLSWVLAFFTSRFIPLEWRPPISVALLPTLETVLYGANVSDILTRFTHPFLDVLAWLPYGVIHFTFPFVVAFLLWIFRRKEALHTFSKAFGYMNLIGVLTQILFPCAAPWYELIYGLTPADYSVPGSPGGLARIDRLLHQNTYTVGFHNSPVVFGAFPSLHAGCATMEALFVSHFFPQWRTAVWAYAGLLYWATMYLTHHYLIDVVAGACLAIACFYFWLPDDLKGAQAAAPPVEPGGARGRAKYGLYDIDEPLPRTMHGAAMEDDDASDSEDMIAEHDITYRSPVPGSQAFAAQQRREKKNHKHTASIASLIRADDRVEDGWSPIGGSFGSMPPTPTRATAATERELEGGTKRN
ncbi:PAP2-domain-containing protein [Punctularia strigosozonata HHB-11173 SS5]|uniref:PAP2-domain-containing protein n=1 Tax=Punctularia strigosozonata (strain HHB-11173) TaxID=741275 RepID=R7S216_PUNST|nr:PAP2-domain-containing protein [Punctularia strigosozonata HHB-11173 SS5]EIN04228.1 PAP2-domain-containing protein [Punctularia strigosozonata HHB-11173 SS5]